MAVKKNMPFTWKNVTCLRNTHDLETTFRSFVQMQHKNLVKLYHSWVSSDNNCTKFRVTFLPDVEHQRRRICDIFYTFMHLQGAAGNMFVHFFTQRILANWKGQKLCLLWEFVVVDLMNELLPECPAACWQSRDAREFKMVAFLTLLRLILF